MQVTFVIADACVNFRNLDEAGTIIREAARAGVDAVKFQAFRTEDIILHERGTELSRIVLLDDEIKYLSKVCKHYGVEFMCTPMYPNAVRMLSPYVKRWKVRYADRNDLAIFKLIYNDPRPVLVSCSGPHDTIWLRTRRRRNIVLMFCVPEYPPAEVTLLTDFRHMGGFSSHYVDIDIPITAVKRGAGFLEVHVMLDNYDDSWIPIDAPVSLNMTNLKNMVKAIRHFDHFPDLYRDGDV